MTVCNLCGGSFDVPGHVRWRKDGHDIVECPACGLLFRAHLPSREELDEIYGEGYFAQREGDTKGQGYLDYVGAAESHRGSAKRRLADLERAVRPGRLLDVGAAAGFFVDEAGRSGWDAQGIDVSGAMVDWGREHLGAPLELGELPELDLPASSFDAVTMWDYLEHSRDPAADVDAARALLRPGGILALSTGDAASLVARASGRRWHLLTPRHHNFFFTARTLAALLERHGFRIVSSGHPGGSYPVSYVTYKLRTLVDAGPVRALAARTERSALGRVNLPLNLFDILTVVARREPGDA